MWYQLEKSVQKSENIKNNWCIDPTTARINAGITKLCGQRAKKLASSDACLSSSAQNLRYWWDDTGWYIWISRPQKKVYYFMRKLTFFLENRQQWQQFLKYTLKRGNYGVPGSFFFVSMPLEYLPDVWMIVQWIGIWGGPCIAKRAVSQFQRVIEALVMILSWVQSLRFHL